MKRGDWGGGPQVKSPAANKLLMDNLNRDKQGVYLVVYDNPYKKSPGHIATIFYNEDKKQWEEYSDYMAPVQGYSSRKSTYGYHYGGSPTNTIRAIYKLNDKEAKN
jgi:hypothetical protein